ncbi:hypothetical protein F5X96DRAFT_676005 [Biscogniauxia mediterranea]|nr:hypothetical protein F5X96DRAFT_676005 [Biscogniauxia mediterranea]
MADSFPTPEDRSQASGRPRFEDLPLRQGDPPFSAWGLWGSDDEIGALNLLTPDVIKSAAQQVSEGIVVTLNLPLHWPLVPLNPRRKPLVHNIIEKGYANDDEIYINTQTSSQWDGLRHYPYQDGIMYYNGTVHAEIAGEKASNRLGIQNIAKRGICGRGVLLDWRSWVLRNGIQYSPFSPHVIPLRELKEVAKEQNVTFQKGDILLIRSGWTEEYQKLTGDQKTKLAEREVASFVGVDGGVEMAKWHWDNAFAAVASDTSGYEVMPFSRSANGMSLHEIFLSGWGMPIGEFWDLEELSKVCQKLGRWTFLLTSVPLNLENGIASPPNAMATF